MALVLIVVGLLVWLLTIYDVVGIILLIVGLVLLFVYPAPGPGPYFGRRWGPP